MLNCPDVHVVLVGGPDGVILEQGWEKEPRVRCTSGKWSMRQTLSMIDQCNLIIGPETGVMNAASCSDVPKIVLLSHSSHENLTRDWVNVLPVWSGKTSCKHRPDGVPACHMMNYGWAVCQKDEITSTAQCQADIDPAQVWEQMVRIFMPEHMKEAA